jgi:hypothetical protein
VFDRLDENTVLKCQRQQHRGVSCDGLDVVAGLAAVDEDLAQCAVIEKPTVTTNG